MTALTNPVHRDDWGNWGPAMQALPNDGWREFVYRYVREKPRKGALVAAARAAGFCRDSTPATAAKLAWKMAHDERAVAAITEESRKILRVAFPEGANALMNLIRDPEHRDHARAIGMLLDRTFPVETRHNIEVTHKTVDADQEALEELRALRQLGTSRDKLLELFGSNGLDRIERLEAADKLRRANEAKVIDGELVPEAVPEIMIEEMVEDEVVLEVAPGERDDF
jgi:phage terminase small subunit